MDRNRTIIGVAVLIILIGLGAWWWYYTRVYAAPFPLDPTDHISSWSFKSAYTGNTTLESQARAEEKRLAGLLGSKQYPDYDLYVGMADEYELLGDGKSEYAYLNRAIDLGPNTGLAYLNMGHLMSELGAYNTARTAYAKAVGAEPGRIDYHVARLEFLTEHFASDTAGDTAAFADAEKQFGAAAATLQIKAPWLAATGHIEEAIAAWQTVEKLSPPSRAPAIEAEIAKLRKQLPS